MLLFLGARTVVVVLVGEIIVGGLALGLNVCAATGVGDTVHSGAEGATGEEVWRASAGGDASGGDGNGLGGITLMEFAFKLLALGDGLTSIPGAEPGLRSSIKGTLGDRCTPPLIGGRTIIGIPGAALAPGGGIARRGLDPIITPGRNGVPVAVKGTIGIPFICMPIALPGLALLARCIAPPAGAMKAI